MIQTKETRQDTGKKCISSVNLIYDKSEYPWEDKLNLSFDEFIEYITLTMYSLFPLTREKLKLELMYGFDYIHACLLLHDNLILESAHVSCFENEIWEYYNTVKDTL